MKDEEQTKEEAGIYVINGHRFVDLGLPSGLLWAETNIGAKTAADDGDYYAWGETSTKKEYSPENYKYGSTRMSWYKYNLSDEKAVLDKEDDAAYVNWGTSCRMPTATEIDELCDTLNCTWTWTSKKNSSKRSINGYKVTSKKNGNSIFLPASGLRNYDNLVKHNKVGKYWSSSIGWAGIRQLESRFIYFESELHHSTSMTRHYGHTIRPVAEP